MRKWQRRRTASASLRAERLESRIVLSARSLVFPQANAGPGGLTDTYVDSAAATTSFAAATSLQVDLSSALAPRQQSLIQFAALFGTEPGQIRPNDTIRSASLSLASEGFDGDGLSLHRMLEAWTDTATWSSLGSGIQNNGVEAVAAADATTGPYDAWSTVTLDVTASLEAWQADPATNYGWTIFSTGKNGGWFGSAESSASERRPMLTVEVERAAELVSVSAVDPFAFEGTSPGSFVISRTDTTGDLVVPYLVGGTASAGTDYAPLPGSVTILAGSHSATVTVMPLEDGAVESPESVTLQITSSTGSSDMIETDLDVAGITIRDAFAGNGLVVPLAETFALESLPGARHTIYLDFLGSDRAWSRWNDEQVINTPPFSIDDDHTSFSDAELLTIQQCWAEVAEDFRPFQVNVTTAVPEAGRLVKTDASDREWGIRAVFGDPTNWHEVTGGMAYYNSFGDEIESPAWIVPTDAIAVIASHEIGHSLGLHHDGWPADEYYDGHGSGETLWGPIMGGPDFGFTQWSRGDYPGATNQEDDLAIITSTTNGFGYRADDHADSLSQASPLLALEGPFGFQVAEGTIERNTDVDWFRFTLTAGTYEITIDPLATIGNLDVRADLFDAGGTLIATSNPVNEISASFRQTLAAGTYFVRVDGDGNPDPSSPGYTDYGSLGFYTVQVGPAASSLSFEQGVNGYAGTVDTSISRDFASTSKAAATSLMVDGRYSSYPAATLIRFNDLFGTDAGMIPPGAFVRAATLELNFIDPGSAFTVHQMLRDWSATDTYTSLVGGVTADGVEAAAEPLAVTEDYVTGWYSLDITAAVTAWLADPAANYGLLLQPGAGTTNGNDIASAESATPPRLTVSFMPPAEGGGSSDLVFAPATGESTTDTQPRSGDVRLVKQGGGTLILDAANSHTAGTVVEAGQLVVRNVAALGTGSLEIRAGGSVRFDVGNGRVSLPGLRIEGSGVLDVGSGSFTLGAGDYDLAAVRALVTAGRSGGTWAGPGITSGLAQTTPYRSVGSRVAADGSLIVGFAAVGDATLDGIVNVQDLIELSSARRYGVDSTSTGWWQGDFNDDGRFNVNDLILLSASRTYGAGTYLPAPLAASSSNTAAGAADARALNSAPVAAEPMASPTPTPNPLPTPTADARRTVNSRPAVVHQLPLATWFAIGHEAARIQGPPSDPNAAGRRLLPPR